MFYTFKLLGAFYPPYSLTTFIFFPFGETFSSLERFKPTTDKIFEKRAID